MTEPRPRWSPPAEPDIGATGTRPARPEAYASPLLRAHGEAFAEEATRRFYEAWPGLMARYGERGRQHTHEDQFWHLATLDAALAAGSPETFLAYVDWLRGFLAGRGMGDDIAKANFVYFQEALAALPGTADPERATIAAWLDAAIARFDTPLAGPTELPG